MDCLKLHIGRACTLSWYRILQRLHFEDILLSKGYYFMHGFITLVCLNSAAGDSGIAWSGPASDWATALCWLHRWEYQGVAPSLPPILGPNIHRKPFFVSDFPENNVPRLRSPPIFSKPPIASGWLPVYKARTHSKGKSNFLIRSSIHCGHSTKVKVKV